MAKDKSVLNDMNSFIWTIFPEFVSEKISKKLGKKFSDGSYLAGIWQWAFVLPPLCFILGLIIGGTHIGFVNLEVFTFSITIITIMIILAVFSNSLGLWLCIGYAIGDLFIFKYSYYLQSEIRLFDFIIKAMVPRLIPIFFLYMLLVLIPVNAKNLVLKIMARFDGNHANRRLAEALFTGVVAAFFVYGWSKAVPILIRPVFSWQSQTMPGVLTPLYEHGWKLSLFMGLGLMIRSFIDHGFVQKRVQHIQLIMPSVEQQNKIQGIAIGGLDLKFISILITTTIFATFLLSGLYTGWKDALIVAGFVLLATFLKMKLLRRQKTWNYMINRVPIVFRLIGGILICWLFYKYIAGPNALNSSGQEDQLFINAVYKSLLYTMLVSIIYYACIFPDAEPSTKIKTV